MKRLRDLQVQEVSLVDRPAVRDPEHPTQPARFLLWKSEDGGDRRMPVDEKVLEALDTPAPESVEKRLGEVLEKAKVEKALAEAARGALRLLNAYKDKLPKEVLQALAEAAGYGYPEPKKREKPDDEAYGEPDKEPDKPKKGIRKDDLPPEVREYLEKAEREAEALRKKAEEAERIAKAEREARLHREYVEKAAREYSHIAKAEELGPVLRALDEKLEKADAERLHQWLRAADERIEKGALFAEFGRNGATPSSAVVKVEAKAEEIRKADPKLTKEQAFARALEANPELYVEYLRERGEA